MPRLIKIFPKNKRLTLSQWREIGRSVKDIRDAHIHFINVTRNVIPKTLKISSIRKIEKGYEKLQSVLEERMLRQYPDLGKEYITYFYKD